MTYGIFLVGQIWLSKTAEGVAPGTGLPVCNAMSPSKRFGLSKRLSLVGGDSCFSVCVCEIFSKHSQRFHIHYRIWKYNWFTSCTSVSSTPLLEMMRHSWVAKKIGIRTKIARNDGLDFILDVLYNSKYNLNIVSAV